MPGRTKRVRRKRRAAGRLVQFVREQSLADGYLPLVHITRAYSFDDMLDGDGLIPCPCETFGEDLIYLFYGRPAYRAKEGNNARLEFEWPIVFVLEPHKIPSIRRVFPFDSGAFHLKLYEEFFDPRSQLPDFELDPSLDSARRMVGGFYVDHAEYYQGSTRKNVQLPNRQFEAQGLYELSRLPGVQGARSMTRVRDERSSAIEIQVDTPVNFLDALLAVVLPEPDLDDDEVKAALDRWKPGRIETYATLHNLGGEAWVGEIYAIVQRIYKDLGFPK